MKKKYIFIIFFVLLLGGLYFIFQKNFIFIGGEKIKIEIADSFEERKIGLMFREELCESCGMLFIFPEEDYHNFWMKNTLIPLDIIFIDKDLNIISIVGANPCLEENCSIYTSENKSLYVLEVNKDRFSQVLVGEKIEGTIFN